MKYSLSTIIVLLSLTMAFPVDYKQEFGSRYTWAIQWVQKNNSSFEKYASQFNIPAKELKAIVFPELIRYNTVYDAIEINTLKYLYVIEGKAYADFSVGYFQMKPSFAEMVEQDAAQWLEGHFLAVSGFDSLKNQADNEKIRKERLNRITNTEQQIIYLCAFYKICQVRFDTHLFSTENERIKFYSTCYNAGYRRSYDKLVLLQQKNYFHTGNLITGSVYNYSDISSYYFQKE